MGMMPLCLLIYTKMWTDADAIILPYDSIGESSETALSLLSILPPVTTISIPLSCSQEEITSDFLKYSLNILSTF